MLKSLVALPVFYLTTRIIQIVVWIGDALYPDQSIQNAFDWLIGRKTAEELRNDHAERMIEAIEGKNIEYTYSKQKLVHQTYQNHRKSISRLSRGESMVSIIIGILAVIPYEIPSALPRKNVIIIALVVILVVVISFRETASHWFAFHGPSVFDSHETLDVKQAWNAGYLAKKRIEFLMLYLSIVKETDERLYDIYLDIIADRIQRGGSIPRRVFFRDYWPRFREIMREYLTD